MGYENKQQQVQNKKFNPRQILQSDDRCHKCGDSKHIEGFQWSGHKYHCKIVTDLVILVACATRSKNLTRRGPDHSKHISLKGSSLHARKFNMQ